MTYQHLNLCDSLLRDILLTTGELYVSLVGSSKAHARILNVDPSAALVLSGVVGYIDHTSIPGSNKFGLSGIEIFAVSEVQCISLFQYFH